MYSGTSIGIAVREDHLDIVCLRGRWRRVTVTGYLRIENYLARPPAEVAREYQRFRKENHALTTSAMVALPRGAGLVRALELPAEVAANLAQAVGYQVDSLHPFEEGSVYFDYAVLPEAGASGNGAGEGDSSPIPKSGPGGRLRVAVALVEKAALERLYQWCCQAGIDVAGFTFSSAVLYQALNGEPAKPAGGAPGLRSPLVLLNQCGQSLEVLGITADGAFYSKEVPAGAPLQREVELCAAELRVAPEGKPLLVWTGEGDPPPLEFGVCARLQEGPLAVTPDVRAAEFRLREHFVAFAAALPGLERRLPGMAPAPGLRWNLLPRGKRIFRSHWEQTAAYALAALVLALGLAWVATGWLQDRLYASWLNNQIRALSPRVQRLERLDSRQKALLQKLEVLQGQQQDIPRKLQAWEELTRLVPASAWLQSLQFQENNVILISGQAESASAILQSINQSAGLERPEFLATIAKNSEGRELFQMRLRLREVAVAAPAATSPATSLGTSPVTGAPPAPPRTAAKTTLGGKGAN